MKVFDLVTLLFVLLSIAVVTCHISRVRKHTKGLQKLIAKLANQQQQSTNAQNVSSQQPINVNVNIAAAQQQQLPHNITVNTAAPQINVIDQRPIVHVQQTVQQVSQPVQPTVQHVVHYQQHYYPQSNYDTTLAQQQQAKWTSQVEVVVNGNNIEMGNSYISRVFSNLDKKLTTTKLINRRTDGGETVFVPQQGSEDFIIKLIESQPDISLPKIDKTGWTAKASSWSTKEQDGNGLPQCLIDNNINTYWITNYGKGEGAQGFPHYAVIDAKNQFKFKSFSYTPLQTGSWVNGNVSTFKLFAADTEQALDSTQPICEGSFKYFDVKPVYINLDKEVSCKYIKFECVSGQNGRNVAGGSQLDFHTEFAPETGTFIKCSELEYKTHSVLDTGDKPGKQLVLTFSPINKLNIEYSCRLVYTQYDGDFFMRKYVEVSVPESQRPKAKIDYIDVESLVLKNSDQRWGHPPMEGRETGMSGYLIAGGQPVYIQGMFLGLEFPMSETEINYQKAHIRYYCGKSLQALFEEKRVQNNVFRCWPAVTGAARSTANEVIAADLFEYIKSILCTPNKMRTQYNSWFDWMLDITEDNILESFREIERGLTQGGAAPLDAYVVDDGWNAYGKWKDSNTTGFWQFNNKFPNELAKPKALCDRFATQFGLWLGPRGGYVYNDEFSKFLEEHGNGERNPAASEVCVNHKHYLSKLQDFFIDCQKKYDINYWKLDGWSSQPCPRISTQHVTGGCNGMHYMTEHWERACAIFIKIRREAESRGQKDLWLNITCFVNLSPWFLQYVNSVWMQISGDLDRKDVGLKSTVDQLLTYRDGCYYDLYRQHQFQFPHGHLYNHDPIYGKTNSNLEKSMDDDEFRTYLFMIITRGAALQNLYYSYNLVDEGQKWAITCDVLDWKQKNFQILRNAQLIGGNPNIGEVYGFSAWDGCEGIVSLRNPKDVAQTYNLILDRNIGVKEGAKNMSRKSVLNFRSLEKDDNKLKFNYGQSILKMLQPGEAVIWQFSLLEDKTPPTIKTAKCHSETNINVTFDKRVDTQGAVFKVNGVPIQNIQLLADWRTVSLTTSQLTSSSNITLEIENIKDHQSNVAQKLSTQITYHKDYVIASVNSKNDLLNADQIKEELDPVFNTNLMNLQKKQFQLKNKNAIKTNDDFEIQCLIKTTGRGQFLEQAKEVSIAVDFYGHINLQIFGKSVMSNTIVNDGKSHLVCALRECNGMLRLYIDGQLDASTYDSSVIDRIIGQELSVGSSAFEGAIGRVSINDHALNYKEEEELYNKLKVKNDEIQSFQIGSPLIYL